MPDRFSEVFNQPPGPRKTSASRLVAGAIYKVLRLGSAGFFLLTGFAVLIPVLVFLYYAVFPDKQERIPYAERVGHAHGLAIDPAGHELYITTTRGAFWIKDPTWAQRIGGDSYQDLRGLIAIGPHEFLAGGRPDIRDRVSGFAPAYSGLIRSTNAGASWRNVSLSGKANFTILEARHAQILAFDALNGGFMVSKDGGKTWETLSRPGELTDFSVSPVDANQIVGLTNDATLLSNDGGRSWRPLAGIRLKLIDWQDALWGVAEDGGVYLTADPASGWEQVGTLPPGTPESLLVFNDELYVSIFEEEFGAAIYASYDGAQTWQLLYRDPPFHEDAASTPRASP